MEKKDLTAADVWAMFAETDRKMQENARQIAESHHLLDENLAETRRIIQENDRTLTEKFEALGIKVNDLKSNVVGIGDSNGEFAEEYFYTSLKKKMEFAGVHFDDIDKDIKLLRKLPNGERLKDQFDIVMINDDAVALVEIKYTARKGYPTTMVNQKVPNFRTLFPDYASYKIYLGLGAMSISEEVAEEAKKLGIGLLRQVGETVEYETKWVRAY
ncbi:MAG: hypothetical protein LBC64_03260 [Fibromonadaceae bacterium]|jgi:hypothetical protein|nr:hypothetical protein [Fibromonadaceae bacterium]